MEMISKIYYKLRKLVQYGDSITTLAKDVADKCSLIRKQLDRKFADLTACSITSLPNLEKLRNVDGIYCFTFTYLIIGNFEFLSEGFHKLSQGPDVSLTGVKAASEGLISPIEYISNCTDPTSTQIQINRVIQQIDLCIQKASKEAPDQARQTRCRILYGTETFVFALKQGNLKLYPKNIFTR
jgi:hypothetical protein